MPQSTPPHQQPEATPPNLDAPPSSHSSDPSAAPSAAPHPRPPSPAEPSSSTAEAQSAYNDLRRLIPSLASELDHLRASLREHNVWLQRYGHAGTAVPAADELIFRPPSAEPSPSAAPTAPSSDPDLPPAYSASDVPPYTGGPRPPRAVVRGDAAAVATAGAAGGPSSSSSATSYSTIEDVRVRRDQLTGWLAEGEDVLREYSARLAQLREELGMAPDDADDVLGTWNEAGPDNALPDYQVVEEDEDRMVGGVGEVPPPYIGGGIAGKGWRG